MSHRLVAGSVLIALCLISTGAGVCQTRGQHEIGAERQEARRFWDAVVKAKGGRERLESVQNLLVQYTRKQQPTLIQLFAFPDKYWEWSYGPPFPEVAMGFYKGEAGLYYSISDTGVQPVTNSDPQGWMDKGSVVLLLETRWVKPEPVKVTRQRRGGQLVDVIETKVGDERIDFTVDIESLLVLNVSRYSKDYKHGTEPWWSEYFSDYVNIDGIQMPLKEALDNTHVGLAHNWLDMRCRINVVYDPDFFDAPPQLSAGTEAWRPKR
jgi:hypothetical protein